MFILFDGAFLILALFYIPYVILRRKWHVGMGARLGRVSESLVQSLRGDKNIWIHAVSVGEVGTVVDLAKKLKQALPQHKIICSVVTKTGYQVANDRLKDLAVVIFAPLDFSCIVLKYLRLINPVVYISAETEIWPNMFYWLHKKNVPIAVVNGRISDKSFAGYKRFSFLTRPVLSWVTVFCMQSKLDAERIIALGARESQVKTLGNLKFDSLPQDAIAQVKKMGINQKSDYLVAGSTHPGEEKIIFDIYQNLSAMFPDLRLILAPRHVERADDVFRLVEESGGTPIKLSAWADLSDESLTPPQVIVVDQIGKLNCLYALATIVFMGKSLTVSGGQNMIEPASLGKAVIVGPLIYNFRDVVAILLKEQAIIQVENKEELALKIRELLNQPSSIAKIGASAKRVVEEYRGATDKTCQVITELIS